MVKTGSVFKLLNGIRNAQKIFDDLENKRVNIGKVGFKLLNALNGLSKKGIKALWNGLSTDEIFAEMKKGWETLIKANLPRRMSVRFEGDVGQETVEFILVHAFYLFIIGKSKSFNTAYCDALRYFRRKSKKKDTFFFQYLDDPAWLGGTCDTVGELRKLVVHYMAKKKLSNDAQLLILERYMDVNEEIYEYLDIFETAYGMCVDNSDGRAGWRETFRGKLQQVSNNLFETEKEILFLRRLINAK